MGRAAVDLLKKPCEMKLGKAGLAGHFAEIGPCKILVDKQLCAHDTAVKILFGVKVHRGVNQFYRKG